MTNGLRKFVFRINLNTIFAFYNKANYDRSIPFRPENAYVHALSLRQPDLEAKFQIPSTIRQLADQTNSKK